MPDNMSQSNNNKIDTWGAFKHILAERGVLTALGFGLTVVREYHKVDKVEDRYQRDLQTRNLRGLEILGCKICRGANSVRDARDNFYDSVGTAYKKALESR